VDDRLPACRRRRAPLLAHVRGDNRIDISVDINAVAPAADTAPDDLPQVDTGVIARKWASKTEESPR
jgi:hypothetical protein